MDNSAREPTKDDEGQTSKMAFKGESERRSKRLFFSKSGGQRQKAIQQHKHPLILSVS